MDLSKKYWANRYVNNETGWDVGQISQPLKAYIDQLQDKSLKILIPGCGNGHEAAYLYEMGFHNVYLLDIAKEPLLHFLKTHPRFPEGQILNEDFFKHQGHYDLILEQTFFCAINPELRIQYAQRTSQLLMPKGKLVGLLFNFEFNRDEPPFGGTKEEYFEYFRPYFKIKVFEECYNSIKPRAGSELFIILLKK